MQPPEHNEIPDSVHVETDLSLVLTNAIIYSHSHPDANTVVIEDRRIIWLGDSRVAEQLYGHHRWIDLAGKWIAPLFVNAHYQPSEIAVDCLDFAALHIHANTRTSLSTPTSRSSEPTYAGRGKYVFYPPLQSLGNMEKGRTRRYALTISETGTQQVLLPLLQEAIEKHIAISFLVSSSEEVDLLVNTFSLLTEKYSAADIIFSGMRFEYTIPCSVSHQSELARLNIPICLSGQSILDNYALNPVKQDLTLFLRSGNILALGFMDMTISSWASLALLAHDTEVFPALSNRVLFHAATRGGHRIAGESTVESYEMRVGSAADFAIWEVDEYMTPGDNNPTRGRWSLDPRSRTPRLPQFTQVQPHLWGSCYHGDLTIISPHEVGA